MAIIRKFNRANTVTNSNLYNTPEDVLKLAKSKNIGETPLDVEALAQALSINVKYIPLENEISGVLEKDISGQWTIKVNKEHPKNRQRFTIAHEIAHFCLHRYERILFTDVVFFRGKAISPEESAANRFAGELLMPEKTFMQQLKKGNTKIDALADFFGVSALALRVRAKFLGIDGHGL